MIRELFERPACAPKAGSSRPNSLLSGVWNHDTVRVVDAPGSGDDEIVRVVERLAADDGGVVVVTADRELRRRVADLGASVTGPTLVRSTR